MGTYLSTPAKDKHCENGTGTSSTGKALTWAAVEMQGWRKSMEDSFIAEVSVPIPVVAAVTVTSNHASSRNTAQVFGVFDGHGGSEVALFTKRHLVHVLMDTEGWKAGEVGRGLVQAFHGMDVMIDDERYRDELRDLEIEGRKRAKNPDNDVSSVTTSVVSKDDSSLSSDSSNTGGEEESSKTSPSLRKVSRVDAMQLFQKLLEMRKVQLPGASVQAIPDKTNADDEEDTHDEFSCGKYSIYYVTLL